MAKFKRKSIFVATGSLAAVLALTTAYHSANAQPVGSPPPAAPGTPAALAPTTAPTGPASPAPIKVDITPAKIAVVNLGKLFQDSQQLTDKKNELEGRRQRYEASAKLNQLNLKQKADARALLKPGTDAFESATGELERMDLQFQTEAKLSQLELAHSQTKMYKEAFDSVQVAVAKVATEKGLDLVVVDSTGDLPAAASEGTLDQLGAAIAQHTVLYMSPKVDITGNVALAMAIAYKTPGAAH